MQRVRFDKLYTVRLVRESRNGRVELCQDPDGTHWVRLCIMSPVFQREILNELDEMIPARIENHALELLLPWQEGISLQQWLFERTPTLGQRRDACLSLLGQQVDLRRKLPPCLTVLSASTENLSVQDTSVYLQYLPELRYWEPDMSEDQAVCAVAAVIYEILKPEQGKWFRRQLPEELQLLYRRQKMHDYTNWGQLQRDVAAIPDELPRVKPVLHTYMLRIQNLLSRYGKYILRVLAGVLLTAALLSLLSVYLQRRSQSGPVWQGMPQVGDQDLRSKEGGE